MYFERTIDRGCVQVSLLSPPIDCSFCPKKRRGPSRFICRFNNRGSLCATLFEWLIRCLQPSGPTHNAARGNFATPSTFHSPLATLLLQHRLPSFYTLQSSFPVHPCVPRFDDVANFSPSLILPLRVASFRYFHVGHAIIFHSAASPPSRRFLPSKILDSNLSEIRFFHFFTSMIDETWIGWDRRARSLESVNVCARALERRRKIRRFLSSFFFFFFSSFSRDEMVWNVFERSGQAPKMVKSNVTFVTLAFRTLGGLPWGARPEPGSIRTRAIIESIMFHSDVPLFFLPLHLLSLRPCDGVSPLPGGGSSLDSQLL